MTALKLDEPQNIFREAAAPLFKMIGELESSPWGHKSAAKARKNLEKAIAQLQQAFEDAR